MNNANEETNSKSEEKTGNFLLVFMACLILFLCVLMTFRYTKSYIRMADLDKNGVQTSGTVIHRLKENGEKGFYDYSIRYEFENRYARETCSTNRETRTTPKNEACKTSIQKQSITAVEYKTLTAPQSVDVLYLPSEVKTRSRVLGLGYDLNTLRINIFLSLIGMGIMSCFLFYMFILSFYPRDRNR